MIQRGTTWLSTRAIPMTTGNCEQPDSKPPCTPGRATGPFANTKPSRSRRLC